MDESRHSSATDNAAIGSGGGLESAIEFVLTGQPAQDVDEIGQLHLPSGSAEAHRCREIATIIRNYAARKVKQPLSFAVFGPPGSGKSFCVEQIVTVAGCGKPFVINLSQISEPRELAESLKGHLDSATQNAVRNKLTEPAATQVFFFDEFDASLAGASLGWLRWFLAPMQDGKFFLGREVIEVGKAIFIFAGGTAISLAEFEKRARESPHEYREKKVPDFISRLRGYIDIEGINSIDNQRILRRALVLHRFLDDRWPGAREAGGGRFPMDEDIVGSLLSNVHFVHGVRSMQALLDMSLIDTTTPASKVQLPDNELRKLHLSRGLLDGKIIGISAGVQDPHARLLLQNLAEKLLQNGATLAYGGDFTEEGTLSTVVAAAESVPDELVSRKDKRIHNYLAYPTYERGSVKTQQNKSAKEKYVDFIALKTLSAAEMASLAVPQNQWFAARDESNPEKYNPNHHLAWAISLFRMRARMIEDVDALIVVGGKDDGLSWGRFPGIPEEVMLAIAMRKPIYVLGGRGGGAFAVGKLLSLDATVASPENCMTDVAGGANLATGAFTLPGHGNLPQTMAQLRNYLFARGVTTPAWPRNGLLPEENRKLFGIEIKENDKKNSMNCADLIIAGLLRLDWPPPARPALT